MKKAPAFILTAALITAGLSGIGNTRAFLTDSDSAVNPVRPGCNETTITEDFPDGPPQNPEDVYVIYSKVAYTVTFMDGFGNVLKVQDGIDEHGSAEAPENPVHEGYRFIGWDVKFDDITGNITVTALYVQQTAVEDVKAGNRSWDTYKVLDSEGKLYIVTPSGIYNTHGVRQK